MTRTIPSGGKGAAAITFALLLASCTAAPPPPAQQASPAAGPYADGRRHHERVRYNGRDYDVALRHEGAGIFHIVVSAPHRRLGHTAGDGRIVEGIALSTLRHFACRSGARASALPGTLKAAQGRWQLKARCV